MSLLIALVLCGADAENPKEEFVAGMLLVERSDERIRQPAPSNIGFSGSIAGFGGSALPGPREHVVDYKSNRWPQALPPFGVAVMFSEKAAPLVKGDIIFQVNNERVGNITAAAAALKKPGRKTIRFQRYDADSAKWLIKSAALDK